MEIQSLSYLGAFCSLSTFAEDTVSGLLPFSVLKSTKHIQMMLARMLVGVAVVENYHLEIIHL